MSLTEDSAAARRINRIRSNRHPGRAEIVARNRQAEERSDPFMYARVLAHLNSGLADFDDYATGKRL